MVAVLVDTAPARAPSRAVARDRLLRYYCVAHRVASLDRGPVTIHNDAWAYCRNGCAGDHDWRAIEPITHSNLLAFGPRFLGVATAR